MTITDPVDYCVSALTIWREAQGEPAVGQRAVAHVIRNRIADKRWPDTAYGVCLQPLQFSCFNSKDATAVKWPRPDDSAWRRILDIVKDPGADNTDGANHYHVVGLKPAWADARKVTLRVGNHIFYRL